LESFSTDEFDYIVIDEFHHAEVRKQHYDHKSEAHLYRQDALVLQLNLIKTLV
jgi:superfamily II DNA or RNA helicase